MAAGNLYVSLKLPVETVSGSTRLTVEGHACGNLIPKDLGRSPRDALRH